MNTQCHGTCTPLFFFVNPRHVCQVKKNGQHVHVHVHVVSVCLLVYTVDKQSVFLEYRSVLLLQTTEYL